MGNSKIEWTEKTWNPVTGCTKISPGCQNCYAERMAKRLAGRCGYPKDEPFRVTLHPTRLEEPLHWRKPSRIFVCSMGDLFHHDVPDSFIDSVFAIMALRPDHTFLILTKRATRMKQYCTGTSWQRLSKSAFDMGHEYLLGNFNVNQALEACEQIFQPPLPNLWLGVTAENQEQADKRIPILLQIPAAVRFVSVEPMLSEINLSRYLKWPLCKKWRPSEGGNDREYGKYQWVKQVLVSPDWVGLDLVICGGESGPRARPMHPDWARTLRDQCVEAGVPFFLKQMEVNGQLVKMPELDGQRWAQWPEATS